MKIGDVVQLKSGGPSLMVDNIFEYDDFKEIKCVWFDDNNEIQTAIFDSRMLVFEDK